MAVESELILWKSSYVSRIQLYKVWQAWYVAMGAFFNLVHPVQHLDILTQNIDFRFTLISFFLLSSRLIFKGRDRLEGDRYWREWSPGRKPQRYSWRRKTHAWISQGDVLSSWRFIHVTFYPVDVLSTWRFIQLMFYTVDVLSSWSFIQLTFYPVDVLSSWRFIQLTFNLVAVLSSWRFIQLTFYPIDVLSNWRFIHLTFYPVNLLSSWPFIQLTVT
jgi:hypothetical protein